MRVIEKEQRFTKIYNTYINEIYSYVHLRTGFERSLTEDLTQEIFIDVYKSFDKFKGLCSERTWVFKIARNKVFDYYRKQYSRSPESSLETELSIQIDDPLQDVEAIIETSGTCKDISECMNNLPQHYKIALLLKYADGKKVNEIAAILDKSNKAIENILQRAKLMFIKEYQSLQQIDGQNSQTN
jgi:RNA polymerase sigma-70 factor (ECF subfamily)